MLVSCWLETCDRPSGWVSLDEHDNDLLGQDFLDAVKVHEDGTVEIG